MRQRFNQLFWVEDGGYWARTIWPDWAQALVLSNSHAFGRSWTARVEKGSVLLGPS